MAAEYLRPLVKLATDDDASDIARLMGEFRDWQGRTEPSDESIAATVRRLLADPNAEYLLAGDPAAGVCQLRYRLSVWTGTDDCCLEDLFVEEAGRGAGMGRALVEAAVERARERGCARMDLDANEANEPALALYRSVGFGSWSAAAGGNDLFMRLRL
jgi:ribosomal protein S18 acetylase RimI-like enzyme